MTLIIMLILAGISLSGLIGEKGLFKKTEDASSKYNEAKAREVLETVLLTDGQFEKNTNPEYNQDDFLDELIKKEIPSSDIKGDVAIIGEYAYELDRSVPKIGHYLGNPKDLIFPVVTVAEITQADPTDNYRTAKIEITATIEEKAENGINRIEIWQNGIKLNTIECNNEKTITTEYEANKNGVYTIKAYSKITNVETSGSAKTTVEGIVPTVEFTPNGSTEWKKSHTTTVKVKETEQTVTNMKYLWKKCDEGNPNESEFTACCTNNSQIIGQGETMTGKYYLWVLVTLGTGTNQKTYVNGSKEFYFDNEGPSAIIATLSSKSEEVNTLNIECEVNHTSIARMNLILNNKSYNTTKVNEGMFQVDVDSSEGNIDTAEFEAINSAGDIFKLSKKDSVVSTSMWDTTISHVYQWTGFAYGLGGGIWGASSTYIQRYKGKTVLVSFDVSFEEDTGYFNVKNSGEREIVSILNQSVWVVSGDGRFKGNEIRCGTVRQQNSYGYYGIEAGNPIVTEKSSTESKGPNLVGVEFVKYGASKLQDGMVTYKGRKYYCER